MQSAKETVAVWLRDNPDKWLSLSFTSIGKEISVSASSVDRYLPELIAERDGILPSEVLKMREEAGLISPRNSKTDYDKIREVIKNNPDSPIRDLAYLAKCTPYAVKKALEIEKGNQGADNNSEVNNIDAEITRLQEQREKLSQR